MNLPDIDRIYVEEQSKEKPFVKDILSNVSQFSKYQDTTIEYIPDHKLFLQNHKNTKVHEGKTTLLIYDFLGKFVHSCPGSNGVVCCNYFVINFGTNCSYDCEYCYLQTFLNNPFLTLYGNIEELIQQVVDKINKHPNVEWRIGSGEYTDSLALESITNFSSILIPVFADLPNATLELKTKSNNIQNLLSLKHNNNTVVGWSINPEFISQHVEKKTASTLERILAAKEVIDAGYQVAFHFDPIIFYDNWKQGYKELIELLFDHIPTHKIRWISLGTFRYSHGLDNIIRERNTNSILLEQGEMLVGEDKKTRYFAAERSQMYQFIQKEILKRDKKLFVYLCMETKGMWQRVYQKTPKMYELDQEFIARKKSLALS